MYKIAVLGDYDSIYGFATIGLDTFPVTDTENAAKQLHTLAANDYSVIYVTEELADRISEEIEKYAEQVLPAIIQIPVYQSSALQHSDSALKRSQAGYARYYQQLPLLHCYRVSAWSVLQTVDLRS